MAEPEKILLIRMLGLGDVTCVGVPALRHWQQRFPDAEIHFMTYAAGAEVIALASPATRVLALEKGDWPDHLLQAMETFLGLAETIIKENYSHIVNLDTWFMPCFLARFLKDAGESVEGNWMGMSVQQLLEQFQVQTLQPDFVNDPANYMESSYLGMSRWHYPWWQTEPSTTHGYPEYYLRRCCGFGDIDMDWHIEAPFHDKLVHDAKGKKILALSVDARTEERGYPHGEQLKAELEAAGYHVWTGFDGSSSMATTLAKLKSSNLLITVPSAPQWLASAVGCRSLVISGRVDPRTLMPDFATDMSEETVSVSTLVESVHDILRADA